MDDIQETYSGKRTEDIQWTSTANKNKIQYKLNLFFYLYVYFNIINSFYIWMSIPIHMVNELDD